MIRWQHFSSSLLLLSSSSPIAIVMDSLDHENNKPINLDCSLTFLVTILTILVVLVGSAFFTVTYIPLSQDRVHGLEAIILYKSFNYLGLGLVPFAFLLGTIGIAVIKHKLHASSHSKSPAPPHQQHQPALVVECLSKSPAPPPPHLLPHQQHQPASVVQRNAVEGKSMEMPMFRTKGLIECKEIETPDYEYVNELIHAFVREEKKGKGQLEKIIDV